MEKLFLFLYPHEIFFNQIPVWSDSKIMSLDDSIRIRYRNQGWSVGYVTYNNWGVSKPLTLSDEDLHIRDGQNVYDDFRSGVIRRYLDGKPAWPDAKHIVSKLPFVRKLRVAGFHDGSCVDMVAKEAHGRGIDTLVDEDLTNLFVSIKYDDNFSPVSFPGFDRCSDFRDDIMMKFFMERRAGKPWLYDWSKYVA